MTAWVWAAVAIAAVLLLVGGAMFVHDMIHARRHRRAVAADQVDVNELRKAFPVREQPSNVTIIDWRERVPYDQDADPT